MMSSSDSPQRRYGHNRGGANAAATAANSTRRMVRITLSVMALAFTFYCGIVVGMHFSLTRHLEDGDADNVLLGAGNSVSAALAGMAVGRGCPPTASSTVEATDDDAEEEREAEAEDARIDAIVESRVREALDAAAAAGKAVPDGAGAKSPVADATPRFNPNLAGFASGLVRIPKSSFLSTFDYGVPPEIGSPSGKTSEVLLLYGDKSTLPTWGTLPTDEITNDGPIPMADDAKLATANCGEVSVVLTGGDSTCVAVMGSYKSYHIQRWLRSPRGSDLRHAGRGFNDKGGDSYKPPTLDQSKKHWDALRTYLDSVDDMVKELTPIAKKMARDNTIVVMVCNMGQSALLVNFACSARARGLDTSMILVFVTDVETLELARGLGLEAYYDEKNFGDLPSKAARRYMDRTFTAMMYAKVVVVNIVNLMGYDVLFQDVDVVWYKDPLPAFHDKDSPLANFDVMFQDDGARSNRYAPYSANTGFYYVRHNERTRYLFINLLFQSDLIIAHGSHQQILTALLTEHASLHGLRVKTLDLDDFPGGVHYHRHGKWNFMREVIAGKKMPYVFHMSWTENKDNKLLFMKQMGLWYAQEACVAHTAKDILGDKHNKQEDEGKKNDLFDACCSAEPLVSCHYRDKPSIIDCSDKPPIDKGARSFWQKKKI